ncbi:RDD family protein [Brevibacillus sp. NRS-1366]|uniref:RDD family protein n=1 Tax=Brevibacillus sp. NRS-1366 TaxID=3233899 RepID=UPI003D1CEF6D
MNERPFDPHDTRGHVLPENSYPADTLPHYQFAGFWIRVCATLLDSLFLIGISLLIFNPLRRALGVSDYVFSLIDLIEVLFDLLYMVLLTWVKGQTLGKVITGIRVISARQARANLSAGQVILREVIGKMLASLPFGLGYMWVGWNHKKQGWHDLIAKTYVVWERRT